MSIENNIYITAKYLCVSECNVKHALLQIYLPNVTSFIRGDKFEERRICV